MIKIDKMINKMMIFKNFMVYKNWNLMSTQLIKIN